MRRATNIYSLQKMLSRRTFRWNSAKIRTCIRVNEISLAQISEMEPELIQKLTVDELREAALIEEPMTPQNAQKLINYAEHDEEITQAVSRQAGTPLFHVKTKEPDTPFALSLLQAWLVIWTIGTIADWLGR